MRNVGGNCVTLWDLMRVLMLGRIAEDVDIAKRLAIAVVVASSRIASRVSKYFMRDHCAAVPEFATVSGSKTSCAACSTRTSLINSSIF